MKKIKYRTPGSGIIVKGCKTGEESKEKNNKSPQKMHSFSQNI